MFEYQFYESRSNNLLSYGYQPHLPLLGRGEGWLKVDIKNCCWRLKGGRRILKSVFIFLTDATFCMNLGQIAHKLWLLPLLPYLPLLGIKGCEKLLPQLILIDFASAKTDV